MWFNAAVRRLFWRSKFVYQIFVYLCEKNATNPWTSALYGWLFRTNRLLSHSKYRRQSVLFPVSDILLLAPYWLCKRRGISPEYIYIFFRIYDFSAPKVHDTTQFLYSLCVWFFFSFFPLFLSFLISFCSTRIRACVLGVGKVKWFHHDDICLNY